MGGLLLGMIGGLIAGGATALGSLTVLIKNNSFEEEKSITKKLELFLGFVFLITALNFNWPLFLEDMARAPLYNSNDLWNFVLAFLAGVFYVLLSHKLVDGMFDEPTPFLERREQSATSQLMIILIKCLPIGFATGATMNIAHPGLSYSLMAGIVVHSLFVGVMCAYNFMNLGIDPLLTFVGSLFIAAATIVASGLGGHISGSGVKFVPFVLIFSSGAMISTKIYESLKSIKKAIKASMKFETRNYNWGKYILNPTLVSGIIVTLGIIIWKELL